MAKKLDMDLMRLMASVYGRERLLTPAMAQSMMEILRHERQLGCWWAGTSTMAEIFPETCGTMRAMPYGVSRIVFSGDMLNKYDGFFDSCGALTNVPPLDTSRLHHMNAMFSGCGALKSIPPLDTSNVYDFTSMFFWCGALTTVPSMDTSKATYMAGMFSYCRNLRYVPPMDTSKVMNMRDMFFLCEELQAIPPIDTSKAVSMAGMFQACTSLQSLPELDARSLQAEYTNMIFDGTTLKKVTFRNASDDVRSKLTNDYPDITFTWK